ncbi:MAG TPA: thiamine pyrophosphate-dependent enzyme [Jiangellales bacterium]|nr:thiamine pyrophosphate-dependent enzyme [Jiangellales bacterium]
MAGTEAPVDPVQAHLEEGLRTLVADPGPVDRAGTGRVDGAGTVIGVSEGSRPPGPGPHGDHAAGELPLRPGSALTGDLALRLWEAGLLSRRLDLEARRLRATGRGLYTIGSAGHEGNAAVAAALRPSDPALLHYRSGAFYCTRAGQVDGVDPVEDILLGLVGAADEPIAGGRHKVFGRVELAVVPTTSTIASHLPRAVGLAVALDRARRLGLTTPWPEDAVVLASVGDASVNHSTALGALNTAGWCVRQGVPVPLLVVCEDNGLGISVPSPLGWVGDVLRSRPGLGYLAADGCDLADAYDAARDAVDRVRSERRPVVLHLRTVRLMGHAGADVESAYRSVSALAADLARDPLLTTARRLVAAGVLDTDGAQARWRSAGERVRRTGESVLRRPSLRGVDAVTEPLSPGPPEDVAVRAAAAAPADDRARVFRGRLPEDEGPLTLAQSLNRALLDAGAADPGLLVFGEDVARKGGVYGVTRGLADRLGRARVFDTVLDEQAVLGLALGAGLAGLMPVAEIQYLAYLHNAEDQVRGEAASLAFFSQGRFRNPMVVRMPALADPHGFGGHFHNDDAVGVLRDVPGLVVAVPVHPSDAPAVLRTCLAAARTEGRVCVVLEPTALYHARDLLRGDGAWTAPYAPPGAWAAEHVPVGSARVHGGRHRGADLLVVTLGTGLPLALRAARRLSAEGAGVRVLDLRWVLPLPVDDVLREARSAGRVLVVDPTRSSGGVSEGVLATLVDGGFRGGVRRLAAEDSFLPLGPAAADLLPSEEAVLAAARRMLGPE